jgi:hypothetical protein
MNFDPRATSTKAGMLQGAGSRSLRGTECPGRDVARRRVPELERCTNTKNRRPLDGFDRRLQFAADLLRDRRQ